MTDEANWLYSITLTVILLCFTERADFSNEREQKQMMAKEREEEKKQKRKVAFSKLKAKT